MYSNFMFLDRLLLSYRAKTWKHRNTETRKHENMETHTDSDEYSIVAFCKNGTITSITHFDIGNCLIKVKVGL